MMVGETLAAAQESIALSPPVQSGPTKLQLLELKFGWLRYEQNILCGKNRDQVSETVMLKNRRVTLKLGI